MMKLKMKEYKILLFLFAQVVKYPFLEWEVTGSIFHANHAKGI